MSYHRSLGQPITSPSEVDDTTSTSGGGGGPMAYISDLIQRALHPETTTPPTPAPSSEGVGVGTWAILGAAALGTYWLLAGKKRGH